MTLAFQGHVMSWVTWPLDSGWVISYWQNVHPCQSVMKIMKRLYCLYCPVGQLSWLSWKSLESLPLDIRFLGVKCTKFDFGWGAVQTPFGELTVLLLTPWLHLRGPTVEWRGRGGKVNEGEKEGQKTEFEPPIFATDRRPADRTASQYLRGLCDHRSRNN